MNAKTEFFKIMADDTYGLCPAPTSDKLALDVLREYLLGEDWYTVMPLSREQVNTEIVASILERYSKKYRKDLKNFQRRSYHEKTRSSRGRQDLQKQRRR